MINIKSILFFSFIFLRLINALPNCDQKAKFRGYLGVEERAKLSDIVFHGLAVETIPFIDLEHPPKVAFHYSTQFWLINVYKGAEILADLMDLKDTEENGVINIRDRRVNVTRFFRPNLTSTPACWTPVSSQKYYIIFAEVADNELTAKNDDLIGATVDYSEANEQRVWRGVGWDSWTEWGACSASCGEGIQERWRHCLLKSNCQGYNKESRRCNMFSCQGAMSPLSVDQKRFFHPSLSQWERTPGRETAWRLRPNSYLWLPATELPFPEKRFCKHFALLMSIRLDLKVKPEGTLLSLRSRRQKNSYLSVELDGHDTIKLVHAGPNGTQRIIIPAPLGDGKWHQLALGIQDDSSVRSYLDCRWVSTDILKRNALDTPEDADLVIGYLFSGDLEQLVIVPDPSAVAQQCSPTKTPSLDHLLDINPVTLKPKLKNSETKTDVFRVYNKIQNIKDDTIHPKVTFPMKKRKTKKFNGLNDIETGSLRNVRKKGLKKYSTRGNMITWTELPDIDKTKGEFEDDEDEYDGSGANQFHDEFEVEWTSWSRCSVSCGTGTQIRSSRCIDTGAWLELCLESGSEQVETRACAGPPCTNVSKQCGCQNGGICHIKRRTCHCPAGYEGKLCETPLCSSGCLHGGTCQRPNVCICPPQYTGDTCQKRICSEGCKNGGTCSQTGECLCLEGYKGEQCEESILCSKSCKNGGHCVAKEKCSCMTGWEGSDCSKPTCNPACESGGRCIGPSQCLCPPSTTGLYCQNFTCSAKCVNGGVCVGPDLCECPNNATGPTCAEPLCEPPCENGATCAHGNICICNQHTAGTRCQKRKCEYHPVQEPYTRGFRRLMKKRYETKCENGLKSCIRTIPEYQTVYKTFYRTVYKCTDNITL